MKQMLLTLGCKVKVKYNILYKKFKDIGVAYAVVDNYQGGKYFVVINVFGVQKVDSKILAKK